MCQLFISVTGVGDRNVTLKIRTTFEEWGIFLRWSSSLIILSWVVSYHPSKGQIVYLNGMLSVLTKAQTESPIKKY